MSYSTLTLASDGPVATITLNRPEKRNAISAEMIQDLLHALHDCETGAAQVVILTGAGKAFCSGMDIEMLKVLAGQSATENVTDSRRMASAFHRVFDFPKPLIAAVNGPAIAGGCGLATLCDFTLAVPEAQFGYTEVRIGFIPALVSVFLRRQIGEKQARDLLLTGRIFDAEEACRLGLVNAIVPADKLLDAARALADSLLVNSPSSLRRTKALLSECAKEQLNREIEWAVQENAAIRATEDFREGLSSFLEKRKPVWKGK